MRNHRNILGVIITAACLSLSMLAHAEDTCRTPPRNVSVRVDQWPPVGPGGSGQTAWIKGLVNASDPAKCFVVVYAFTDMWYVQPSRQSPLTRVSKSGEWRVQTHLGSRYTVFVVEAGYQPPGKSEWTPPVGGLVVASTTSSLDGSATNSTYIGAGTLSDIFTLNHARMNDVIRRARDAGVQKVVFLRFVGEMQNQIIYNTAGRDTFSGGVPKGMLYLDLNSAGIELVGKRLAKDSAGVYSDDVLYIFWKDLERNFVSELR